MHIHYTCVMICDTGSLFERWFVWVAGNMVCNWDSKEVDDKVALAALTWGLLLRGSLALILGS